VFELAGITVGVVHKDPMQCYLFKLRAYSLPDENMPTTWL
jgi:hypothetical protein